MEKVFESFWFWAIWRTLRNLDYYVLRGKITTLQVHHAFFVHFLAVVAPTTTWRSVHTRRQVAATCRSDTLQRQIAPCVLENFCENLCSCNRILLPQQVAQIQSDMIFCDLLQRQNSVSETKIFTKIFQYTRSDLSLQLVARPVHMEWSVAPTCCCNLSPSVYRPSEST